MQVTKTNIDGALVIEPKIFLDSRGSFCEAWNLKKLKDLCFLDLNFVQENQSSSKIGVLRGLHYQLQSPQGKLVRVAHGSVLDVIVDLRKSSPSFGKYFSIELSSDNNKQLWIPPGIAHGFLTLKNNTKFIYQTTEYYDSDDEYTISWNDQSLNIDWKLNGSVPLISDKDISGIPFLEAKYYD